MNWSHSTTRQRLSNEAYLGVARAGGYRNESAHPAIIERELWELVQGARTPSLAATGALTSERLLQGLARCSGCGRTLKVLHRTRADGSRVSSYYCKDAASSPCPDRAYVHADELDSHIADWFSGAIASVPRMVDIVAQTRELENAQRALTDAEAELVAFVENAAALDPALFQRGVDSRQSRVREAREAVETLSGRVTRLPAGGSLLSLWQTFGVGERREVLGGFLDRIEVRRGASGDLASHVAIFWSDGSEVGDDETRIRVAAA